ncbi:MAG: hypothetical protein LC785_05610 [Acidobacteria bacterium]|nr:hypothetical protein [Acidobacteriota bacterium]MCA1641428.1 hypothetical protein [Acidobacteriota bacterium]
MRKFLTLALLLAFVQTQTGAVVFAAGATKSAQTPDDAKVKINRAGVGEKARVTVWLKDGTKHKGYVAEHREVDFVLRDRKTDAPSIIAYRDVAKVDINRGHSTARNVTLGALVGVSAFLLMIGIAIGTSDD